MTSPPPPPPPRKPWVPPRLETAEVESVWAGHNVNPGDADAPTGNFFDSDAPVGVTCS